MDSLIREFPDQLLEAIRIGEQAKLTAAQHPIKNVLVCGLGGSGIGANFVIEFTRHEIRVPYAVTKGYDIPQYVDEHTLVICSSYSGNTEETLYSFEEALAKKAKIVCVASGGKLLEKAKQHGLDWIQVPPNKPSPRACLGYSFVQQLVILKFFGLIEGREIELVRQASDFLKAEEKDIVSRAEMVAQFLHEKYPIIYTTDRMESVAVRLRQQLNENAKILCSHHVIPEMNHNELVGWREQKGNFGVLIFRNHDDFARNQARLDIIKEVFREYAEGVIEIYSKGDNIVEKTLYLVYLGDFISWFMAELRGVDAVEVKVIDYLKGELAKL